MSLVLERIRLTAGSRALLRDWSLQVAPGRIVLLRGPSGIGKSSLLAYIAGALPRGVTGAGRVLLDGRSLDGMPAHRRRVGMLFQDDVLFPHMTVAQNLLFGLHSGLHSRLGGRAARRAAVEEALAGIEMGGLGQRDPASLSGGQRARVALARVLLSQPRALLLDEPFTGLDPALRARLGAAVAAEVRARGLPCLWVSHEPVEEADRVEAFP